MLGRSFTTPTIHLDAWDLASRLIKGGDMGLVFGVIHGRCSVGFLSHLSHIRAERPPVVFNFTSGILLILLMIQNRASTNSYYTTTIP